VIIFFNPLITLLFTNVSRLFYKKRGFKKNDRFDHLLDIVDKIHLSKINQMSPAYLSGIEKNISELLEAGEIISTENSKNEASKFFNFSEQIAFKGNIKSKVAIVTYSSNHKYLKAEKQKEENSSSQSRGEFNNSNHNSSESNTEFNIKIFNYLKPFQIIRFDNDSLESNLQKFNDQKFHIDLIPYFSKEFTVNDLIQNYSMSKSFVDHLLNGVLAYPRQYVVFVGDLFTDILSEYIEETDRFSFMLTSPNKVNQKITAYFTRVTINYKGRKLIAGVAESFFDVNFDDIMLEKYGQESVYLINRGLLLSNPVWSSQSNFKK